MEGWLILGVLVVALLGPGTHGAGHREGEVKVLTYNTGLFDYSKIPTIPNNRDRRLQATVDALRDSTADVVCLQEVWIGQDLEAIVNQVDDTFRYSYSPLHDDNGNLPQQANVAGRGAVCDYQDLRALDDCVDQTGCSNDDRIQEQLCATAQCPNELARAFSSQKCVTCITISGLDADDIIRRCSSETPSPTNARTINNLGLALFSRRPMSNPATVNFYEGIPGIRLIDRGYLSAKVGDLNVVCTHLTSVPEIQPPPPSPEPILRNIHPSYAAQNEFEVGVLMERFRDVSPLVLLGDFNIALDFHAGLVRILPDTYYNLARAFDAHIPARECTFCEGSINVYNEGETSKSIDHVFGNGIKIIGARVMFKDQTFIDGTGTSRPFSDHFGFESVFLYPRTC